MRGHEDAVSEVVSTLLSITIVVAVVVSVLFYGTPYMERLQAEAQQESIISQFSVTSDSLQQMIHGEAGGSRQYTIDLKGGSLNMDPQGDRFIVSYAVDPAYNFTVKNLNDDDNGFNVTFTDGSFVPGSNDCNAKIYWFDDDPVVKIPSCDDVSLVSSFGDSCSFLKFNLSSLYEMNAISPIEIMSVQLRLVPVADVVSVRDRVPVRFSFVQDQSWNEQDDAVGLGVLSVSSSINDGYFSVMPSSCVVSTDLLNLFLKSYENQQEFFSVRVDGFRSMVGAPFSKSDSGLLFVGGFLDRLSFFGHESGSNMPELVINYLKLGTDLSQNTSIKNNVDSPDVFSDSNSDYSNVHIYSCKSGAKEGINEGQSTGVSIIPRQTMISGNVYRFQVDNLEYHAYFQQRSSLTSVNPVFIENDGCKIAFTPGSSLGYISSVDQQFFETGALKSDAEAVVEGNQITYPGQYGPGIDLRYIASESTVKEELLIHERSDVPVFSGSGSDLVLVHQVDASTVENGISLGIEYGESHIPVKEYGKMERRTFTGSDRVYFTDEQGKIVFVLPEIFAWDSNPLSQKIQLSRTVVVDPVNGVSVWICTPMNWLSDLGRVFPVVIDDTTNIYSYPSVKAYHCLSGAYPPLAPTDSGYKLYYEGLYSNIASDDDVNNNSWNAAAVDGMYVNLLYNFSITEDAGNQNIVNISVRWNGYDNNDWDPSSPDFFLYIWNYTSFVPHWDLKDKSEYRNDDTNLTVNITSSELQNYLGESYSSPLYIGYVGEKFTGGKSGGGGNPKDGGEIKKTTHEDYIEAVVVSNYPPNPPSNPHPFDGETDVSFQLSFPDLTVDVSDPEGDLMNITWWSNFSTSTWPGTWQKFAQNDSVPNGTYQRNAAFDGYCYTTYYWKVIVSDCFGHTRESPVWTFRTPGWINIKMNNEVNNGAVVNKSMVVFSWVTSTGCPPPPNSDLIYRYKLKGFIDQWSDWVPETSKNYYDLPDGNYTFVVQAKTPVGEIEDTQCSLTVAKDYYTECFVRSSYVDPVFRFDCGSGYPPLKGTIRIDLYNDTVLIGRVYLFDLGEIRYDLTSSFGSYQSVLENFGVLSNKPPSQTQVKKEPIFAFNTTICITIKSITKQNILMLRVLQLRNNSASASFGGSGSVHFDVDLQQNYVRELLSPIYNVKIQVWGPHEDVWLQYYKQNQGFSSTLDDNTLKHQDMIGSDDTTLLILTQSLLKINNG